MRGWEYIRPVQANGLNNENEENGVKNITIQSNGLNETKDKAQL